jgi:lysophospholipase L1-like esterase
MSGGYAPGYGTFATVADVAGLIQKPTSITTGPYTASSGDVVQVDVSGRSVADAVFNSTTTMTSATAAFTSADVGRGVIARFVPAGTTIASVSSGTTVILSAAATGTGSALLATLAGGCAVTLPASATAGATVTVKKVDSSPHPVPVLPSAGDDIDGFASVSVAGRFTSRRFVKGSGTSWIAADGLTPSTGPSSSRYNRQTDLYLPSDSCLTYLQSALARSRNGGTPAKLLCKGDSTTLGTLGGGGNGTNAAYNPSSLVVSKDLSWVDRGRRQLAASNALGGAAAEGALFGAVNDTGTAGSRFTVTAGVTIGWVFTAGSGGTLTFADDNQSNAYDLILQRSGTLPSGATVAIDGGSAVTVDASSLTTTGQFGTFRFTASGVGTHSVVITAPATGTLNIVAIVPVNTVTPPIVQIGRHGVSGQTLATYMSGGSTGTGGQFNYTVAGWKPDAALLLMGINDMHTWSSGNGTIAAGAAAYKANLVSYVTTCRAQATDPILGVFPSRGYALQSPGDYEALLWHQAIYEVADAYDVAVWDLQRRWGYGYGPIDYAAPKWPMYDGTHPTLVGYSDMGRWLHNFLAAL